MIGPLSYIGGKRRLAKRIVSLIPPHTTYVEPFAGGAQVFFQKPKSRVEVLNDLDAEIVNFLRVCQRHPRELAEVLRWQPASRRLFGDHLRSVPEVLTDVERAARFFYLQKNSWSGLRTRRSFQPGVTRQTKYRPALLPARLTAVADRLAAVQIEAVGYDQVLAHYDRPGTFFYCDPPYVGVDFYQHNFTDAQFAELARLLGTLKGQFLLSINDCTKARDWFAPFHRLEIGVMYTVVARPRRFSELLFANYLLPAHLVDP
jgi:DNA adenine methylase